MINTVFNRPIAILMLTLTIMIFGIISLTKLPINLMPDNTPSVLSIITRYHGVSPEQIERIITVPIENSIAEISNIKEIYSVSEDGKSRINVFFTPGTNMDYAALKVREAVDSVSSGFPRASEKPYVLKNNPADRPIFILTLSSQHLNINDLRTYAELELKKELSRIDGISEIDFTGGSLKEINIDVFPEALLSYNLSITDLSSIIQNSYFVNSQGKVIEYTRDTNLYTDARFKNVDEMRNIPVKWDNESGKAVLLGDIAKIYEGIRTPENISRVNKEERVAIYIKKSGGANTLNVCKDLFHFSQNSIPQLFSLRLYIIRVIIFEMQ